MLSWAPSKAACVYPLEGELDLLAQVPPADLAAVERVDDAPLQVVDLRRPDPAAQHQHLDAAVDRVHLALAEAALEVAPGHVLIGDVVRDVLSHPRELAAARSWI